jgi:hypothetical protein
MPRHTTADPDSRTALVCGATHMVTSLRGELQECGAAVVVIDHDEVLEAGMLRSARPRPPVLLRHRAPWRRPPRTIAAAAPSRWRQAAERRFAWFRAMLGSDPGVKRIHCRSLPCLPVRGRTMGETQG